jgi:hypothetical protein
MMSNPEYQREYRARHREELRAYNRDWMRAYRERLREEQGYSPLTNTAIERATRQIEDLSQRIDRLPKLLTEEQKQRVQNLSTELWRRASP